ncbi:MAG TPA: PDZ domain-containing protein, partial [Candidatus Krumholzibacterium sp.]|nr:PDZ domain-containing protein [Candidatus Krumholzibacterium sp.]
GVLVLDVTEDSPAEEAGMKGGDVIVAVGDIAVEDGEDLLEALGDYDEEDETIKVTAIRKGDRKVFDFKVEDLLDDGHTQIRIGPGDDFKHFKVNIPNWAEQKKLEQLKAESLGEGMELEKLRKEIEILEKRLKRLEKDKD